ncbi:MAG: serine hydrolase [Candidatus Rokuibacteriota bacterium]|nr:MAG: serine hydrolase [Candidatus Rokubacteria bacterium]
MSRRSALLLAVVLLLLFPIGAGALEATNPEKVGLSRERLARIGRALNRQIEERSFPGAVVLVARKGHIAYFEAIGQLDPALGGPMAKDAIFRLYSMTKPFTSVAMMMLVEEGRVRLTDPVGVYLPQLAKWQVAAPSTDASGKPTYTLVAAENPVTLYELMRHTSGIVYPSFTKAEYVKELYTKANAGWADVTPAEQLDAFAKVPLVRQPGTMWEYGMSTDIAGRVIESVTGASLGRFLDERLFRPLRMTDTTFHVPADKVKRLAQPFATDRATGKPIALLDVTVAPKNDAGGAGAAGTAIDYMRFLQMLANGGKLDGQRLLARTIVRHRGHQAGDVVARARLRLRSGLRCSPCGWSERCPRFGGRVLLGWSGRYGVLGGPERTDRRRPHDPGAAGAVAARVPRAVPSARLPGDRRLKALGLLRLRRRGGLLLESHPRDDRGNSRSFSGCIRPTGSLPRHASGRASPSQCAPRRICLR